MRTRGIDWLGTTHALACTVFPERSEVADACVPYLVACTGFPEGSSGVVATVLTTRGSFSTLGLMIYLARYAGVAELHAYSTARTRLFGERD